MPTLIYNGSLSGVPQSLPPVCVSVDPVVGSTGFPGPETRFKSADVAIKNGPVFDADARAKITRESFVTHVLLYQFLLWLRNLNRFLPRISIISRYQIQIFSLSIVPSFHHLPSAYDLPKHRDGFQITRKASMRDFAS
jgi:hypothetical protein